jgi:hypothetical protein
MMKIAIRKPKPKPNGVLNDAVAECCKVVSELRALDVPAQRKLTGPAFLATAMTIAETTPERLAALREKVFDPIANFETKAVLRRMTTAFRSQNWAGPSRELRRYNYNFMLTSQSLSEVLALGSTTFEVAALAVLIATEQHPEDFGTCADLLAYEKRLLELALRRDELYQHIETEYTANDLVVGEPDRHGNAHVTFKISNGVVPLGPNAGERLTNWALANET